MRPPKALLLSVGLVAAGLASLALGQDAAPKPLPAPQGSPKSPPTPHAAKPKASPPAPAPQAKAPKPHRPTPGASPTPSASTTPSPPSPPTPDPFRARARRAGQVGLGGLPPIQVRALINIQKREPLALLEVGGRTQIVRVGERLSLQIKGSGRIVLEIVAVSRAGVRLEHKLSGERIDLR